MATRRSILSAARVSVIDVSVQDYDGERFTLTVKKDDNNWTLHKYNSEFIFFKNSIMEVSSRFTNPFPHLSADNKDAVSELSLWLKECGDTLMSSASMNALYYTFLKANENILKAGTRIEPAGANADHPMRRDPLKSALRTGYMQLGWDSNEAPTAGRHRGGSGRSGGGGGEDGGQSLPVMKKKYFALLDQLYYYENESAYLAKDEPEGCIKLDAYCVSKPSAEQAAAVQESGGSAQQLQQEFLILSFNPYTVEYTCRANSNEERNAWVATLNSFPTMV